MTRCPVTGFAPFVTILALAGCAAPSAPELPPPPQSYVVLMPNEDGTVGQLNVSSPQGEVVVREARQGVNLDGSLGAPYAVDENRIKRDFAQAISASPPPPVSFMLYYELGGTQLTAESQALIPRILEAVKRRPAPDVSVIGHTDTVGAPELNEKLGLQRAQSVAELINKAGLKAHDLTIVSHGERNLLVRTPDETPEPRNRRVEITVR